MKRGKNYNQKRNNQRRNNNQYQKDNTDDILDYKEEEITTLDDSDDEYQDNNEVNNNVVNNNVVNNNEVKNNEVKNNVVNNNVNNKNNEVNNEVNNKKKKRSIYYHSHFLNYYTNGGGGVIDIDKLLDPVSTTIRLALLRYMEDGTKISVTSNKIIFNKPNIWLLENVLNIQGITRNLYGYNREDLKLLYPPIFRSINWYFDDVDICENIKKILKITKKGIKLLNKLYRDNDGRTESYLMYCNDKIEGFVKNNFIEYDELDEKIILDEKIKSKLYETNKLLWSEREIEIITDRLIDIEEHYVKHKTIDCSAIKKYINMINKILTDKDQEFKKIIAYNDINNVISDG